MKLYEEFLKATGIFILVTLIQLSTWEIFRRIDREIDREWEIAIEQNTYCQKLYSYDMDKALSRAFARSYLLYFGQTGLAYGSYCGVLFQSQFFEGRSRFQPPKKYFPIKYVGRVLLLITLYAPRFIMTGKFDRQMDNDYAEFFFLSFLPNFTIAFVVFAFTDSLCLLVRLYDRVDTKQEELQDQDNLIQPSDVQPETGVAATHRLFSSQKSEQTKVEE